MQRGDVLSLLLLSLVMDAIVGKLLEHEMSDVLNDGATMLDPIFYADDVVFLALSWPKLQRIFARLCKGMGVDVSSRKASVMALKPREGT